MEHSRHDVLTVRRRETHTVERLLIEQEVAEVLGKPARTLRQWRYLGVGPRYIKVGLSVRYRARDVEQWIEAQARDTEAAADGG
jgi:predicted DNA-binding transcriptional regulator AlpA